MLRRIISASALLAAIVCSTARADSINVTFDDVHSPVGSSYANGMLVTVSLGSTNLGSGWIGQYDWTQNTGSSLVTGGALTPANSSFFTYCIEITQDIFPGGTYNYDLVDPQFAPKPGSIYTGIAGMGLPKSQAIAALWAREIGLTPGVSNLTLLNDQAAFQVAVWKIEYGDTLHVDNAGINQLASNMVLAGQNYTGALANLIALSSNDPPLGTSAQDQITALPNLTPSGSPAPSPAVFAGGLALLSCVALMKILSKPSPVTWASTPC